MFDLFELGIVTSDIQAFYFWLLIEWMTIWGLICSNVLFLLIRTFVQHKVSGDTKASNKSQDVDSIYAIREYTAQFNAQCIPAFINLTVSPHVRGWQFDFILYSNVASLIMITFIVFVDWKTGPKIW